LDSLFLLKQGLSSPGGDGGSAQAMLELISSTQFLRQIATQFSLKHGLSTPSVTGEKISRMDIPVRLYPKDKSLKN